MAFDLDDDRVLGTLLEGKWRLVRRIGRGGMGQVFQVVHNRMGIMRCVKVLRPDSEDVLVKRFEREVRLAQQIRHENVIRIDDFGVDRDLVPNGLHYYIMEYVEGESLRDIVSRGELTVSRAAHLVRQAALGVHAAHEQGIIHRDIKPENIVVAPGDRVVVLDFGIAKARTPESREDMLTLTRQGEIWATPQYMSPEQALASPNLTPASDIYSLGVVLFECLSGELPFRVEKAQEFMFAHIQKPPPLLRKLRPELRFPEALDALVQRLLEKRPGGRPASMKELADALSVYIRPPAESAPPTPSAPVGPVPKPAPPPPRPAPPGGGAAADRPAARHAPRVVIVPHPPEGAGGGRPRGFPVLATLFVNLGEELHEHRIGRSRVVLGRQTNCDVLVPDTLASKQHAELRVEGRSAFIEDLGSRNGTTLNRKRVDGRVTLEDGAVFRIGNTHLLFRLGEPATRDVFSFCASGHPGEKGARFCGSCGAPLS